MNIRAGLRPDEDFRPGAAARFLPTGAAPGQALGLAAVVLLTGLIADTARAERARFFDLQGFGSWLDGNPEGTAVTENGDVRLPFATRERYQDTAATYSAAAAAPASWGDKLAVARVDDGQILLVDWAGKATDLVKLDESMITAMGVMGDKLLVAAGTPARIYSVDKKGKKRVFHTPDADYVWDFVVSAAGDIYAVTGHPGTVLRVSSRGEGQVLFESEQEHLRSVAFHPSLGVFAGGGERGIVYRAPPSKEKAFTALFDSGHTEITSMVVRGSYLYAAGVSGADGLAAEQGNEQHGGKGKPSEVHSQLAQIGLDGSSEILAGSNDEAIFDVALDAAGNVVVAAGASGRDDPRGRLYTISPDSREIAMVFQSPSRRISHLVPLAKGKLAIIAAAGGRIAHFSGGLATHGEFFTEPVNLDIHSSLGILQLFGDQPKGTSMSAAVRTGNTAKPDNSWSAWSKEVSYPGNVSPQAVGGRYMQIRVTLKGDGKRSPSLHRVRLAYRRQNLRPYVREVVALPKGLALLPILRDAAKSKTVNLGAKDGSSDSKDKPRPRGLRARQVQARGAVTLKWVADDPNGDQLRYDLMIRSPEQRGWRTLEKDMVQPFYTIHSHQLPDGYYQFKVRATDRVSNPDGQEKTDVRRSRAVLIDNSPPQFDPLSIEQKAGRVTVRAVVVDLVGPLVGAEYALDGGDLRPVDPDDGVLDGPGESITIRLGKLAKGSHSITLRAVDEGENVGYVESLFEVH